MRLSNVLNGLALAALGSARDQVPLKSGDETAATPTARRPNVIFILTDDQDLKLGSFDYTPLTRRHLKDQGTFFAHHYVTIALCCPSRVSLWTGKAAHNTNVTDVNPPYGGYPKFVSQGLNENWLPIWLQDEGYATYYVGKLFNAHNVTNYDKPFVKGFTASDFLLDPYTYQYLNSSFQRNHDPPSYYLNQYSTDVLAGKVYGFLDDAAKGEEPFFLAIAPNAPHSNVGWTGGGGIDDSDFAFSAPVSAERHKHLFKDVKIPRTPHFNPDHPSGANWVRELPQQSQENVDYNDHFYRQRLRALQAVDELVDGVFRRLEEHDLLDNTYVIYTSDNGYHIGQHRCQPGKELSYEEDINVPLFIRGPGVPANITSELVTSHTDLAPTILDLIGASPRPDFDGLSIPVQAQHRKLASDVHWHEHVNVEYWGFALGEGQYNSGYAILNNTYKAIRVIGAHNRYNFHYVVWCNDEHELYDLNTDPYQLNNLLLAERSFDSTRRSAAAHVLGLPIGKVVARLDSLLLVLKSCKGSVCVKPWEALHPAGDVTNLLEALAPDFDVFYEHEQARVKYGRCEAGYIIDAEGPQFEQDGLVFRHGLRWSEWV